MQSPYNKLISVLLGALLISFLILLDASANTAHIQYTDTNMYNKIKGELESEGYTVTGTSGGSVSLSDFSSKDLHINVAGNNNCGNNCKTAYETYIGNGGTVIVAGNGVHNSNRTGSIESLIESKLSVGTITDMNVICHLYVERTKPPMYLSKTI